METDKKIPYKKANFVSLQIPRLSIALLVCIFLGAIPFLSVREWWGIGAHDMQRIGESVILSLALIFAQLKFFRGVGTCSDIRKAFPPSLILFFAFGALSCFNAYSARHAFWEWSTFFLLILLAWMISEEVGLNGNLLDKLIFCCGLGSLFYLLNEVIVYIAFMVVGSQPTIMDLIFGFDNYRFFNHTQTISLPILVLLVMRSERFAKQYWFWFIISSLWWTMLFVAGGRGTFVGVVSGVAISWFFMRKFAMEWCRVMAYTLLAGFITYLLVFIFFPSLQGLRAFGYLSFDTDKIARYLKTNPTSNRAALWEIAWQMITEHPLLGGGPLHFAHYASDSIGDAAHPHDWVLQIAAEWGIPAMACLVAAIFLAYRALLRVARFIQSEDCLNQATLCAWLTIGAAILIDGLVSGLIVMPASQLWIALFIGCAWGWASRMSGLRCQENLLKKCESKAGDSIVMILATCALLALFWNGLYPELTNLPEIEANALKSSRYLHGTFRPRIWLAGYF